MSRRERGKLSSRAGDEPSSAARDGTGPGDPDEGLPPLVFPGSGPEGVTAGVQECGGCGGARGAPPTARGELDAETLAALAPTSGQDLATTPGAHADKEAVRALAPTIVGLERSLHGVACSAARGRVVVAIRAVLAARWPGVSRLWGPAARRWQMTGEAEGCPRPEQKNSRGSSGEIGIPAVRAGQSGNGPARRLDIKSSETQELGAARMLAPPCERDNRPHGVRAASRPWRNAPMSFPPRGTAPPARRPWGRPCG